MRVDIAAPLYENRGINIKLIIALSIAAAPVEISR
jgi:hypothetical protein